MKKLGYGIDFGTTNSIISKYNTDFNKWEDFTTDEKKPHPSVVWYKPDNSYTVGEEAKENINDYSIELGNNFISSVKRKLGLDYSYRIFGNDVKAVDVASKIFAYLKKQSDVNEKDILKAIVTIPVDFDGKARRDLRKAADKAGIEIKTFIHEPFAAIVAHCWKKSGKDFISRLLGKNYLVMDWGGGTLDITIAKITERGFEVLAFKGHNEIGGDVFDEKLMKVVSNKFIDRNKLSSEQINNFNTISNGNLKYKCEKCKISLSNKEVGKIILPDFFRIEDKFLDLNEEVYQKEFEELIIKDVEKGIALMNEARKDSGLEENEIDSVLLIGGTCNIPIIKSKMSDIFGSRVEQVNDPDLIIAQGAALIDGLGFKTILQNEIALRLADNSHHILFKSHLLLDNLIEEGKKQKEKPSRYLYCTDPRGGLANIIISNYKDSQNDKILKILSVPVSTNFNKLLYNEERIDLTMYFDEDLILHLCGKSATQGIEKSIEIYDIPFGLSLNI